MYCTDSAEPPGGTHLAERNSSLHCCMHTTVYTYVPQCRLSRVHKVKTECLVCMYVHARRGQDKGYCIINLSYISIDDDVFDVIHDMCRPTDWLKYHMYHLSCTTNDVWTKPNASFAGALTALFPIVQTIRRSRDYLVTTLPARGSAALADGSLQYTCIPYVCVYGLRSESSHLPGKYDTHF